MRQLPLLAAVLASAFAAPAAAADRCPRSAQLHVGALGGPLYSTTAPFEHFTSGRTQVFPHTCTLRELTGKAHPEIALRSSPDDFSTPYNAATRARGQLYLYGYGANAATEGGYVASIDTKTLKQRWRTRIPDTKPDGQWSYPGVMVAHGNGFLYAVYGSVMVKLDPLTGKTLARRELPEDPNGTGAAYNGMIVLPDGRIVAKKIERGPCPSAPAPDQLATAGAITGLQCSVVNGIPSVVVAVDPRNLKLLSQVTPPESVTGRVTYGRSGGRDFVYMAGSDTLFRYVYAHGKLSYDKTWGPVTYRTGQQKPGTAPGVMGHWLVVQTNFLPSPEPLTVTAVDIRNPKKVFRIQPFADVPGGSFIVSKAALDVANGIVVTHDTTAGRMAALKLDPKTGFTIAWTHAIRSFDFSALTGDAKRREIVISDATGGNDEVVWLSERTGEELARSASLANTPAPGNIVTPGFDGRFYYASSAGRLWELRPR